MTSVPLRENPPSLQDLNHQAINRDTRSMAPTNFVLTPEQGGVESGMPRQNFDTKLAKLAKFLFS